MAKDPDPVGKILAAQPPLGRDDTIETNPDGQMAPPLEKSTPIKKDDQEGYKLVPK